MATNPERKYTMTPDTLPNETPASSSGSPQAVPPRRRWRRWIIGGLAATGLFAVIGAKVHAHAGPGCMHRAAWSADASPEAVQRRLDAGVRWMLADVGASEEQQRRIADIAAAALQDLRPLREQHLAARRSAAGLFAQPSLDRAALEALRAQELALADEASRRITQALADAGEVLTPAQRAQLAARMQERRGWRGA
jgi:Spy/CpxP family protein refolding chaperone